MPLNQWPVLGLFVHTGVTVFKRKGHQIGHSVFFVLSCSITDQFEHSFVVPSIRAATVASSSHGGCIFLTLLNIYTMNIYVYSYKTCLPLTVIIFNVYKVNWKKWWYVIEACVDFNGTHPSHLSCVCFERKIETSALIGAWKCKSPPHPFWKLWQTDQPTDRQNDRPGHQLGSYTSNARLIDR